MSAVAAELVGPDGENLCSCGKSVYECREFGWPHEWDPVATGDDCTLCFGPIHPADEWARHGAGYAHTACIDPPRPEYVDMPLLWEGD